MDTKLKAVRSGHKGAITRLWKNFGDIRDTSEIEIEDVTAILDSVLQKRDILKDLNDKIVDASSDEDVVDEIQQTDEYMFDLDSKIRQIRKLINPSQSKSHNLPVNTTVFQASNVTPSDTPMHTLISPTANSVPASDSSQLNPHANCFTSTSHITTLDQTSFILKEVYLQAESWTLQRQILSIICKDRTFGEIKELLPNVSAWKFNKAKLHTNDVGCGVSLEVESAVDSITDWKAHLMRSRNQEDARLDLVRDLKDGQVLVTCDLAMKMLPRKYREGSNRLISQDSPITSSLIKDTVADLRTLIPDIQEIHIYSDNAGCYKNTLMMASLRRDAIDARQNGQFIVIVVDTVTVIDGEKNNMKSIPGITQLHNFQFVSDGLRADFLEEHRRVLESRLQPVIREITDIRARTREELESLYRKIVSVVLLRSGLGSPTYIAVVREATADLQSVYPQTELGTFMSLTKRDKERQLLELTMIVTGIRLFNKECGKGGEEINDYLMEKMHFGESSEGPSTQLLKESLINTRQHEAFLRVILNDVFSCAYQVESLEKQLATRMEQLQATVQSKTAVPTA
ncbi:Cilia- and flagella-associated protein 206 [Mytilus edulis]|uniref:Cilia- and flagella-associated protein 206 n=1 Tax=Mytilus edulis TaxID=6550 RepID=A0A8S3U204_MYTED|nr:Cilia- and flagella-associated protein 206 [Mytilus edulis]